jgi:hypothetical protein
VVLVFINLFFLIFFQHGLPTCGSTYFLFARLPTSLLPPSQRFTFREGFTESFEIIIPSYMLFTFLCGYCGYGPGTGNGSLIKFTSGYLQNFYPLQLLELKQFGNCTHIETLWPLCYLEDRKTYGKCVLAIKHVFHFFYNILLKQVSAW